MTIAKRALTIHFQMILALRARAGLLTIAAIMMLLLGGCGGSSAAKSSAGSFLGAASNAVILIQWTRSGNAVSGSLQQTLLAVPAATDCDAFVQDDSSDTWTTQEQGGSSDSQVCDLGSGADEVVINDDGGQTYGQQACSTSTNQGWSPKPSSTPAGTVTSEQCPSSGPDAGRLPDGSPCVGPPGTG